MPLLICQLKLEGPSFGIAWVRVGSPAVPRKNARYWPAVDPAEFVEFPRETAQQKGSTVTPEWPIAFTRLKVNPGEILSSFPCNHIHGCYGGWTEELRTVGALPDIEVRIYG